ncbi:MAG: murein biosynthesis integral membrane protein MurJ [Micromonosporaceae bacterium]
MPAAHPTGPVHGRPSPTPGQPNPAPGPVHGQPGSGDRPRPYSSAPPRGGPADPPPGRPSGGSPPSPDDRPTEQHYFPPLDPDATTLIPSLRNAPEAPPTPIPELKFNASDATMVMSAVPYLTPSATPAYTGTIYVSYAATRAQMEDEAAALPEEEREEARASVARSGAIMALGSIVSRLTGVLRLAIIGAALGAAGVGDTYTTANAVPSMVYELLLGGILTSVFVPLLVRSREHDPDRGQAFAQRLLTLTVITLGAAAVLAVTAAPLVPAVLAGENHGPAARALMESLAYLLLPAVFFFGLAGVLQAVLNSRGHFAAPMWTPILNNVVVISTFVLFMLISDQKTLRPENMTPIQIAVLGIGTMLGIATQACGLIPALRRVGFRWRWRFDFHKLGLSELKRLGGWMACYVAVSQIGVIVVIKLAYAAGGAEAAGSYIYNSAFLVFMMAHGIVAVSIITALMPRMSAAAAGGRHHEVARNISLGSRLTSVVLVPVTVSYLMLSGPIASLLLEWGRVSQKQADAAAVVVAVAGLGLVPFAISQLQTFAFYALTETRAAALVNIPVVAAKIAVDIAIFYTVDAQYVTAGLMLGNLCSYLLGAWISGLMLRKRLGPIGQGALFSALIRLGFAGAMGGAACWGALSALNPLLSNGKFSNITRVLVGGLVLMVVYLLVAWMLRVREISDVIEMVDRKLGGRLLRGRSATRPEADGKEQLPPPAAPVPPPFPDDATQEIPLPPPGGPAPHPSPPPAGEPYGDVPPRPRPRPRPSPGSPPGQGQPPHGQRQQPYGSGPGYDSGPHQGRPGAPGHSGEAPPRRGERWRSEDWDDSGY